MLTGDELVNGVHRTGTEKGDTSDYILKAGGCKACKHSLHAARLKLENAVRPCIAKQLEGLFIVKRYLVYVKIGYTAANCTLGIVDNGDITKSKEVELYKSKLGRGGHIKLRYNAGAAI